MKEVKLKPLAKITEQQLENLRGNINQINSLGRSLDQAYQKKHSIFKELRNAYSLPEVDFYVNMNTGEVFEEWPKV